MCPSRRPRQPGSTAMTAPQRVSPCRHAMASNVAAAGIARLVLMLVAMLGAAGVARAATRARAARGAVALNADCIWSDARRSVVAVLRRRGVMSRPV